MFKYIILTQGWDGVPFYGASIAYRLQQEGHDVTLGYAQADSSGGKKEDCSGFDGMIKKYPIKELVSVLEKIDDKDEYFVLCDHNELYPFAEDLVKAGFKNGLFPTESDYMFEKDRELAMEFVKKNYEGIKLIPFTEHSTVDEAISFLEENEGVFVIQSKGDFASTYVPQTDDHETAKDQSISQLNKYKSDYEKGGIILKTKLINPVDITPQIVFYNGEPVFTDLDIETKNIGDGENNGHQVGCGSNLIISTDMGESINKIAFPEAVYKMAKSRKGMFVWDISIYLHEGSMYFGEFCSNRLGYDAAMTEMDMSNGAGKYFESISNGKNPLSSKFGTAIRLFNLSKAEGQEISFKGIEDHVWLFDCNGSDGTPSSTDAHSDLAIITSSADTISESVDDLYEYRKSFSFKELYSRTKSDFLADYPTSIMNRYDAINHGLIEAPDLYDNEGSDDALMEHIRNYVSTMKRDMEIDVRKKNESSIKEKSNRAIEEAVMEERYRNEEQIGEIKEVIKKILYE